MRQFIALCGVAAVALSVCSCHKAPSSTVPEDVRVKTIEVSKSDISGSRVYSGTIEESGGSVVSFPVAGTVQSVRVSEGDRVGRGQLIATLDAATLQNAYDIAQAELAQAQDAYDRLKKLHDANSLPEIQWVEIQNKLRQAQSAAAIAQRSLKDAELRAPVSGYVAEKMMDAGMNAAPGMPVVKIVDINPVKVSISMPESEIGAIDAGEEAVVTVAAAGGKTFTGKVTEKAVQANPISRAYDVKITVANPDGALLPGMLCDVTLQGSTPVEAYVLPVNSVLLDADNQNFVWLDVDGAAAKRIVTVGGMTDAGIVITSGLADGDLVITEGQQKVSNGTKVEVVK